MNINEAKNQIRNAMKAYFTKDNYGLFVLPPEEQRPVFLMGPPGIGKTAIMKQIADELGYSDVANFSRAFKRWSGRSPSNWRKDPYL